MPQTPELSSSHLGSSNAAWVTGRLGWRSGLILFMRVLFVSFQHVSAFLWEPHFPRFGLDILLPGVHLRETCRDGDEEVVALII